MERLNQKTQKPFKRGDIRKDGFEFMRYDRNKPITKSGFYIEHWRNPDRRKYGKKRPNPKTGQSYDRGDHNEDKTKRFWQYRVNSSDKNGYCYEDWYDQETYEKSIIQVNKRTANNKLAIKKLVSDGKLKRRLNPKTGEEFKEGDLNDEGKIFFTYVGQEKTKAGFVGEYWGDEKQYLRRMLHNTLHASKKRAKKLQLSHDLPIDFLVRIFPLDYICPVFKTKMEWRGNSNTSPSLDRIIPELGYVEENVAFMCKRANTLKLQRTPNVLRKIADYVDEQIAQLGKT